MFQRIQHIHFVGIGGSGMSGIASVLLTLGYRVTGSDRRASRATDVLIATGAKIVFEHVAENVQDAHVVVRSSAVPADNPELVEAKARKIPVISRAEMLAELARLKYTVAVAGTHGKTTTTSMIATVLDHAGQDPTFVIGGRLNTIGRNARLGRGESIVLEADESDRSFLMLSPTIAVVTNIEADHLDVYRDLDDIREAFVAFANKVPFYGAVILPADLAADGAFRDRIQRRIVTFGFEPAADIRVADASFEATGSRFTIQGSGEQRLACALQVPGRHNILNAAAAFAAAAEMGAEAATIIQGLEKFAGVERRFQVRARGPVTVIDDYAHHPTEVAAVLAAARGAGFRRIVAAFQPHRFTRTFHLFEQFARAFAGADVVLVTDIYPAGETPIEGVSSARLVERIRETGHPAAFHLPELDRMEAYLREHARPGDAILVMGAGNITSMADALASGEWLEARRVKVNHE